MIEDELVRFINQFWVEFGNRQARTDLENDETGCFSEAPCEAFFSLFDRISHFRQSLKVEKVVSLIRICTEGPDVGTEASHDLIKKGMENYRTFTLLLKVMIWKLEGRTILYTNKVTCELSKYSFLHNVFCFVFEE